MDVCHLVDEFRLFPSIGKSVLSSLGFFYFSIFVMKKDLAIIIIHPQEEMSQIWLQLRQESRKKKN
jgi:hypothetical protein